MEYAITTTECEGCTYDDIVRHIEDFCSLDPDPEGETLLMLASLQRDGILYATAVESEHGFYPVCICYDYKPLVDMRRLGMPVSSLAVYGTGEDGGATIKRCDVTYYRD